MLLLLHHSHHLRGNFHFRCRLPSKNCLFWVQQHWWGPPADQAPRGIFSCVVHMHSLSSLCDWECGFVGRRQPVLWVCLQTMVLVGWVLPLSLSEPWSPALQGSDPVPASQGQVPKRKCRHLIDAFNGFRYCLPFIVKKTSFKHNLVKVT